MTRITFDQQLQQLEDDIVVLGNLVETALKRSVVYLKAHDSVAAQGLIAEDRLIDEKRYAIEAEALTLIATQQPMAVDMRTLAALLFIANELERIGDYAKGIGRITLRIGQEPFLKPLIDIPRMEILCREMLHSSLLAFIRRDVDAAHLVIKRDDEVDALYEVVYSELMSFVIKDVGIMQQANLLLFVSHNLERAADRTTNICERVIYSVTGELLDTGWDENGVSALS